MTADVCRVLGLDADKGARTIPPEEKGLQQVETPGGPQEMTTANRKRSEAAKEQPREGAGFGAKQVAGQSVPRPDSHPGKEAKAAA